VMAADRDVVAACRPGGKDEAPALIAPEAQPAKTCCTRRSATANVHASSLIRCCGNVDKRCKFAAQNKAAGFRPRSCAVSAV
jgi:hypothetical protein